MTLETSSTRSRIKHRQYVLEQQVKSESYDEYEDWAAKQAPEEVKVVEPEKPKSPSIFEKAGEAIGELAWKAKQRIDTAKKNVKAYKDSKK